MKLKKIKNTLLVVLTLALVSAASVALTYAYVEHDMGSKTNTFTNDEISAELSEVKWDSELGTNDTESDKAPDGQDGFTLSKSYYANQVIPKNPKITNTSDTASEYVAIKAEYTATIKTETGNVSATYYTLAQFEEAIAQLCVGEGTSATRGINNNWEANSTGTVFYYKNILAAGGSSARLFDSVKINDISADSLTGKYNIKTFSSATDTTGTVVEATELPEFKISLTGYAVQAEGFDSLDDTVKTALNNVMK